MLRYYRLSRGGDKKGRFFRLRAASRLRGEKLAHRLTECSERIQPLPHKKVHIKQDFTGGGSDRFVDMLYLEIT